MQQRSQLSLWQLLLTWTSIGLQSFGGGSSTVLLIQRQFIEKYGCLTQEDFAQLWNLCIFTPGINLVSLTILIGRKLGGLPGVLVSLTGLLLPSATITCLLTATFREVQHTPAVQAILRGVIPATAGVTFLVGLRFAHPLLRTAYKRGGFPLFVGLMIIVVSTLAIVLLKLSVIPVLLFMALPGILFFSSQPQEKSVIDQTKEP